MKWKRIWRRPQWPLDLPDTLTLAGLVLACAGISMVFIPAALIAGGAGLAWAGLNEGAARASEAALTRAEKRARGDG